MATLTLYQKVDRFTRLLLGLRHRQVALALKERGFTSADVDEGMRLLRALTVPDVASVTAQPGPGGAFEARLRAWMQEHFVAVEGAVRRHHSHLAHDLFPHQVEHEPIPPYGRAKWFLDGYDALVKSATPEAKAVQALFAKRALDDARIAELREMVAAQQAPPVPWPDVDFAEAEQRMWEWYLDWSAIVRTRVRDKRVLRELGFGGAGAETPPIDKSPPSD